MTQTQVIDDTKIPKNRMTDIVNDRVVPKPDEIVLLDKALNQNRRLVYQYCSTTCPAGKYAGFQFSEMDMQTAGMKLISALTVLDKLIPELADMICEGRLSNGVVAKLSQLRLSIMAIEVQLSRDRASCSDITNIREFSILKKEKPPVFGAQTAVKKKYITPILSMGRLKVK